jgi:hypothetical protein
LSTEPISMIMQMINEDIFIMTITPNIV